MSLRAAASRVVKALSVLVLDLDDFKSVNDRYGHEAGDRVPAAVRCCSRRAATRAGDLLYRMGGEEFCFVLPATARLMKAKKRVIAERIRQCVAWRPPPSTPWASRSVPASASPGVVSAEEVGFDLGLLLAAGDGCRLRGESPRPQPDGGRWRNCVARGCGWARGRRGMLFYEVRSDLRLRPHRGSAVLLRPALIASLAVRRHLCPPQPRRRTTAPRWRS